LWRIGLIDVEISFSLRKSGGVILMDAIFVYPRTKSADVMAPALLVYFFKSNS
jgi:hypothetical protein